MQEIASVIAAVSALSAKVIEGLSRMLRSLDRTPYNIQPIRSLFPQIYLGPGSYPNYQKRAYKHKIRAKRLKQ